MNRNNLVTVVATLGLTAIPAGAFAGEGDATALHVEDVVTISDCHAEDGQADCTGLSVLGSEMAGSSQEGEGENSQQMAGVTEPGIGSVTVFSSSSSVDGEGNSQSSSSAATVEVEGVGRAEVLRAQANSQGVAESDGVHLDVIGEEFHILHAQSIGGRGQSAAAVINDSTILGSGEDDGVLCPVDVQSVVHADVICASGARAGVLDNLDILGELLAGEVVTADANNNGAPTPGTPTPGRHLRPTLPATAPSAEPPSNLARTGADLLALLFAGLLTAGAGEVIRRRATGPVVTFA